MDIIKMKPTSLFIATALILILAVFCVGADNSNKGAEKMNIYAGSKGLLFFPHAKHQSTIKSCMKCHALFPQKTGSIKDLIETGKLKKKQVMTYCISCHKKMAKAGKKTGPRGCKKCHTLK